MSQPSTSNSKSKATKWAHTEIFDKLSASIQKKHGYRSSQQHDAYGTDQSSDHSSPKHSSDSDSEGDQGDRPGPSKRRKTDKSRCPVPNSPLVLTFNPEDIIHPRSSIWTPPLEVALYLQEHIRAGFNKDVRAWLRAECPIPDLEGKVADTPDSDPTMVTFMKKWAKVPKKGLDRAWRSYQDKLLDLSRPLAKILEMAFLVKESNSPINPDVLVGWAQRAICHLGNANMAISTERRRSILMHIDHQLNELATLEAGQVAQGLLFRDPFIKDLSSFAATLNSMDKDQLSLKKVFRKTLFRRARHMRGCLSGRSYYQGPKRDSFSRGRGVRPEMMSARIQWILGDSLRLGMSLFFLDA
ncbi:hypothetical protein NDU88_005243 [Pleurodeles waltl]|uniref:Uncharacterized protein n=1 Tax=Pleurodeles waltl TaxID=8319 RepID=A0AAV7PET5_PLEWA|nr:hypothetical protein NDU88_005243 [Pleurodeles waltl]